MPLFWRAVLTRFVGKPWFQHALLWLIMTRRDAATLELLAQLTDVDVVRMDKNVGYGPAINAVALGSDGYDYLCCLNPDAFPASDWLAQLVGSLEADPKLGSAASLLISDKDEQVLDGAGDELQHWRLSLACRPRSTNRQ